MVVIDRSLLFFSDVTFKMAAWQPYWISWFPDCNFSLALNINSKLQWHNTYVYGYEPVDFQRRLFKKWPPGGHIGFFGFQTLTLVWLWISTPNFSGKVLMHMGSCLLIFSGVNFKMATWQPYWIFWLPHSHFSLTLNLNSKFNGPILMYMSRSLLIFSYLIF